MVGTLRPEARKEGKKTKKGKKTFKGGEGKVGKKEGSLEETELSPNSYVYCNIGSRVDRGKGELGLFEGESQKHEKRFRSKESQGSN